MIVMMRIWNGCQAVMHSVSRCQTATFKADAAQISIGFYYALKSRGHDVQLGSKHRFFTFFEQRVIAKFSER
ncbi:hypothetical protein D3C75_997880 [compost metagenome]